MTTPDGRAIAKFWQLVDKTPGYGPWGNCWRFTGGRLPKGYGQFRSGGVKFYAHRFSFTLATGSPPKNWVLHRCDLPDCCNPDHLYDGTPAENERDKYQRGRAHCQTNRDQWIANLKASQSRGRSLGVRYGSTKLTESQVVDIKLAIQAGKSNQELVEATGMSLAAIHRIRHNQAWRHVTIKHFL